jgi:uncharacterized protein (TIGR03382 family)
LNYSLYQKYFIFCIRNADSKSDTKRIVMRKTLCFLMVLALAPMANASSFSIDLSPTSSGTTGVSSSGITPQNVFGYSAGEWHGTWENSSLNGQVGFDEGILKLQIGAVASNNAGGNFAGLKFDMPSGADSATLSFDIAKSSSWGGSLASFECKYICNVYGFLNDGTSTVIGTWTLENAKTALTDSPFSVSIELDLSGSGEYSSYGLIFNSMETSTLSSGAGIAADITNICLSGEVIPEPATATLGLFGLGTLLLRRRRD